MQIPVPSPRVYAAIIQTLFATTALWFLLAAFQPEGFPMRPELFGDLIYLVPAEFWSSYLLLTHGAAAIGFWCHWYKLAAFGTLLAVLAYSAFSLMSDSAQYGDIVFIFSSGTHAPIHLVSVAVAVSLGQRKAGHA